MSSSLLIDCLSLFHSQQNSPHSLILSSSHKSCFSLFGCFCWLFWSVPFPPSSQPLFPIHLQRTYSNVTWGLSIIFSIFARVQRVRQGGGGKSSCTLSKMLVLATVNVHETSLANQHFYSTLLGRREGYVKGVRSVRLWKCWNYGWSLSSLSVNHAGYFSCDEHTYQPYMEFQ